MVSGCNSSKEVREKYQNNAELFVSCMGRICDETSNPNKKISETAFSIDNVKETISQSAEGVSRIAEKSFEAATQSVRG